MINWKATKVWWIKNILIGMGLVILNLPCSAQKNNSEMTKDKKLNIACDIETGTCKPTTENGIEEINIMPQKKVKLIYYTDPICSACWAIEPQLKKFKLEYGAYVDVEYKMGGLLPGWEGFADNANGISKPTDVAHHWDEVGEYTSMSIDGDIWLEDPLDSSFPPSIAFKAAQRQGKDFAVNFLRNIREQLFLEKKNITKEQFLLKAITACQGDTAQFLKDYHSETTKQSFYQEMEQGRSYGVRGFPTFIFIGTDNRGFRISGMSGYANYVLALEKALGEKVTPQSIQMTELDLLKKYGYLATKEISFVRSQDDETTTKKLQQLVKQGKVKLEKQKFGDFWRFTEVTK